MSIINNILELALKKNINANNLSDYGDPFLNTVASGVTAAGATEDNRDLGYGIRLPGSNQFIATPTGTVTVGETTYYCTASGNCCLWTVPAGASVATFQIWGGGGNAAGCCHGACCAAGYFGGTGEYKFIKMRVSPGQTYTLCAGGAPTVGSCYSYSEANGCNSFVCGSNSTCILACGGYTSSYAGCGYLSDPQYPSWAYGCLTWNGNLCREWFYNQYMCNGSMMKPAARLDGVNQGGAVTANTVISFGQVPSFLGSWHRCSSTDYAHMCACSAPVISATHTVSRCPISPGNGYWGGCEFDGCSVFNVPGMGGVPTSWACYSSGPVYGGRGRSGQIIVKYC